MCISSLAAANLPPAQSSGALASDGDHDPDRVMDPDEARDYADQFPLSDRDIEEDNQILATLLERIPSCKTASDIDQLLQDIPVQPPVVVPVRTVQGAVAAGDLPPLDVDAANLFSRSEHILQEQIGKHDVNAVLSIQPGRPPLSRKEPSGTGVSCNMISYMISHIISYIILHMIS